MIWKGGLRCFRGIGDEGLRRAASVSPLGCHLPLWGRLFYRRNDTERVREVTIPAQLAHALSAATGRLRPLFAVDAAVDVRRFVRAAEELGQFLLGLGDALGIVADPVVFQPIGVDGFLFRVLGRFLQQL